MTISEGSPNIDRVIDSLIELWQEFQNIQQNQNVEDEKKNRDLAMGFLNCAKDDIRAVKILYEKQLLSLSVYHLQQAVEKTTKAYALALSVVTTRELKEIKHKGPLTFIKLLKKKWAMAYINLVKTLNPNVNVNIIDKVEKIINKEQKELAEMPKTVICTYLNSVKQMRNILQKQMYPQIDKAINLLEPLLHEETENLKKAIDAALRTGIVASFISLYLLSVITYSHSTFTRYPDGEIKPSDYYSRRLEIVECINDILSEVEICVNALEQEYGLKGGYE
jgi:HEPN domain-containing protein